MYRHLHNLSFSRHRTVPLNLHYAGDVGIGWFWTSKLYSFIASIQLSRSFDDVSLKSVSTWSNLSFKELISRINFLASSWILCRSESISTSKPLFIDDALAIDDDFVTDGELVNDEDPVVDALLKAASPDADLVDVDLIIDDVEFDADFIDDGPVDNGLDDELKDDDLFDDEVADDDLEEDDPVDIDLAIDCAGVTEVDLSVDEISDGDLLIDDVDLDFEAPVNDFDFDGPNDAELVVERNEDDLANLVDEDSVDTDLDIEDSVDADLDIGGSVADLADERKDDDRVNDELIDGALVEYDLVRGDDFVVDTTVDFSVSRSWLDWRSELRILFSALWIFERNLSPVVFPLNAICDTDVDVTADSKALPEYSDWKDLSLPWRSCIILSR